MRSGFAVLSLLAFLITAAGCAVSQDSTTPKYNPRVGWTMEYAMSDSNYYSTTKKDVSRSQSRSGTRETWTYLFNGNIVAVLYFDERKILESWICVKYCQ
jgi:hypothetical protein